MATIAPPNVRIAELNDRCRMGLDRTARIVATRDCLGTIAKGDKNIDMVIAQARLLKAVRDFRFGPDDRTERDFGSLQLDGETIFFKIDYYDAAMEFGSENPADASITTRVLTIMLARDY
jgi:hypothetical protein